MDVTDCVSSSGWPAAAESRGGECWAAAEGGGGGVDGGGGGGRWR